MTTGYTLISTDTFLDDVIAHIATARRRIYISTLILSDQDELDTLAQALEQADQRGVNVTISCDLLFTYLDYRRRKDKTSTIRQLALRLRSNGITLKWLGGRNGLTLFSQRTHAKWVIIDDTCYTFGGINLYPHGIRAADFMLRSTDAELANTLITLHERTVIDDRAGRPTGNRTIAVHDGTLLFDGGMIHRSLIYSRACELARQACHVTFVSQYCPNGRLARALKNVDHVAYFNPPENASSFDRALIRFAMRTSGMSSSYHRKRYLHAKCTLFDMPDGSTIALTGSHNFVAGGGLMGTREIALETTSPEVVQQIRSFVSDNLK